MKSDIVLKKGDKLENDPDRRDGLLLTRADGTVERYDSDIRSLRIDAPLGEPCTVNARLQAEYVRWPTADGFETRTYKPSNWTKMT